MDNEAECIPANFMLFEDLCNLFEDLQKYIKNKIVQDKKLCDFINNFRITASKFSGKKNCTFYPILRLLLPDLERERSAYNLKENKLGHLLVKILSLHKASSDAEKLINFKSVKSNQQGTDFASVAYFVLKTRITATGILTIKDVNDNLDKISTAEVGNKGPILDKVFNFVLRNTTAMQQKWFLRIILKDLKLGMGHKRILAAFHSDAPDHYEMCNDIFKVCAELDDGNTRPIELGIRLFSAISPMLSERLDVTHIPKLPQDKTYQIEAKFDGERFQIHMENNHFCYYSRKGFNYSDNYGETYECGLLTPLFKDCFSPGVFSFILDGEMMGWHKQRDCFGSKGMAFDVKKITDNSKFRPCFCAFDLLYYNGKSLVGGPEKGGMMLKDRLKLLDTLFKDVKGVIMHSKRDCVQTRSDIVEALNHACDNAEEGIVVKDIESYYIANRRNAGWYKIKPEYTEGAMEDLDLVIIGCNYAENKKQGLVNSFVVALADKTKNEVEPTRWISVGRVSTGLTFDQRENLCLLLEKHWQPFDKIKPPSILLWEREKPDFWILPEKSCVLQVRASELICTNSTAKYTMRFPRILKVRDDKPVKDILTLEQFNELIKTKTPVVKLNAKIDFDDFDLSKNVVRRKRPVKNLQVATAFQSTQVSADGIKSDSRSLEGRRLCVLSEDEDCKKDQLESLIRFHSGTVVQTVGSDTWCCIAGRITVRVRNVIEAQKCDIASTSWLRDLPQSNIPCRYVPPLDLIAVTKQTHVKLGRHYDAFGDSYIDNTDVDTLRKCFEKMEYNNEPQIFLMSQEMYEIDQELFGSRSPYSFLRGCFIYAPRSVERLLFKARFFGGTVCDTLSSNVTHVIISNELNETDINRFRQMQTSGVIVTENWLENCFLKKEIVDAEEFLV